MQTYANLLQKYKGNCIDVMNGEKLLMLVEGPDKVEARRSGNQIGNGKKRRQIEMGKKSMGVGTGRLSTQEQAENAGLEAFQASPDAGTSESSHQLTGAEAEEPFNLFTNENEGAGRMETRSLKRARKE